MEIALWYPWELKGQKWTGDTWENIHKQSKLEITVKEIEGIKEVQVPSGTGWEVQWWSACLQRTKPRDGTQCVIKWQVAQPCDLSPQRWGAGVSQIQAPSWLQVKSKAILGYMRHSQEGRGRLYSLGQPDCWREEKGCGEQWGSFCFLLKQ